MKKYFSLISAAALLLVGCAKEVAPVAEGDGAVTFSVALSEATKATADNDGLGAKVDNIKVAVYMHTGNVAEPYKFYDAPEATYDAASKTGTFTVNLIKSQTYQVVVWADKDGRYTCDEGLQEIVRDTDHVCNNDEYDAFFASVPFTQGVTTSTTITAKRPFAQLNFITTDIKAGFEPSTVSVKYTAPSQFNALTDKVSDSAVFTHVADVYKKDPTADKNTLVMDYILVDGTESAVLSEVTMTAKVVDIQENVYNNIPVQRNYRTNIIGALLTSPEDFTVVVDPIWNTPENDVLWMPVSSVAEAVAALANGDATNVTIETVEAPAAGEDATVLAIPETQSAIGITLPAGNDVPVKIVYATTSETAQTPSLNVVAENTDKVEIVAPQSHVTLNGTLYEAIVAETSSTTLVIEQGVTVKDLTVKKGGLEIHGTVNALTIPEGADVVVRACEGLSEAVCNSIKDAIAAGTARLGEGYKIVANGNKFDVVYAVLCRVGETVYASIAEAVAAAKKGETIELLKDLDLKNEAWTPVVLDAEKIFDGGNHTVKNLKVITTGKNVGFFAAVSIATVKNLTIDGADVEGINHVAAIAGDGLCGKFENCHVKNAKITALVVNHDDGDKAGAICGYLSGESVAYIKGCSAENIEIKAYRDMGSLAGMANGGAEVTGNTVKNVNITCDKTDNYKNYTDRAQFNAKEVVGRISEHATVENNSVENVTISYVPQSVAMVGGTEYVGFADAINAALAANDGTPVELLGDIEFAENATWTPIVFNGGTVAIDGKGYTVKGLPGMLFNKQGSGGHHLIMKDITFDGAKVNGTTGNEAVIVGYADAMNELYFENVVIKNSTVTGSNYAAAFVGYAAGYNVLSNGPVFQEVTFKNCVVDNCTITGGGSTGALMGHATGNAWGNVTVTGTTVKNNKVTCSGSSSNKAGSVFGTVGAAGDPNAKPAVPEGKVAGLFVSAEVSGNTVKSGSATITTICGRQGSTGGRLFMTEGGSYDAAPYTSADEAWASCVEGLSLVNEGGVWTVK